MLKVSNNFLQSISSAKEDPSKVAWIWSTTLRHRTSCEKYACPSLWYCQQLTISDFSQLSWRPVLALPPDMPSVSRAADNCLDVSVDFDVELAVLDRVFQVGGTVKNQLFLTSHD